jgi:hypothetical protein
MHTQSKGESQWNLTVKNIVDIGMHSYKANTNTSTKLMGAGNTSNIIRNINNIKIITGNIFREKKMPSVEEERKKIK